MSGNSMQSFEFCTGKKIFYPKIPVCISDKERRKYKYIEIGDLKGKIVLLFRVYFPEFG